jgi:hypothetical protein
MLLHAVVGDIHGQFDALRRLEDRIARHAAREGLTPVVVSVGDLVDRGPASAAVLRHFRLGAPQGTHRAVMGNHEQMFLLALEARAPHLLAAAGVALPPDTVSLREFWSRKGTNASRALPEDAFVHFQVLSWLVQGGATTMWSYSEANDPTRPDRWDVDADDLRFVQQLPVVFRAPGLIVTHALVDREALLLLTSADPHARERSREGALWNRRLPRTRVEEGAIHVSGHSPLARVRRRDGVGVVQCDTGAGFGRRLSAVCVETGRVLSVPVS